MMRRFSSCIASLCRSRRLSSNSVSSSTSSSSTPSAKLTVPPIANSSAREAPVISEDSAESTSEVSTATGSPLSASLSGSSSSTAASPRCFATIFSSASAMYSSFSSKLTVTTRQPHLRKSRRLKAAGPVKPHSTSSRAWASTSSGLPCKSFSGTLNSSSTTFCQRSFNGIVMRCGPSTSMTSLRASMAISTRNPTSSKPSNTGGKLLAAWGIPCMRKRSASRWFCILEVMLISSYTRRHKMPPLSSSTLRPASARKVAKAWCIIA
mmetsp:Transcript_1445/g.3383  ORF Transcript_1445/g.3383 Transcript_1445/m.3383 type:complete len:266 (-) Transcript_1445:1772-2569(-)